MRQIAVLAGVVYFTQGALGIAGIALPLYLRSLNWSVSQIAMISSVAAFPWIFKIVYGLISDTFPIFGYRRKSYLFLCSLVSMSGWLFLVILPPKMSFICFAMAMTNFGFAAVDVVTDGLIVEHSRGPLNSFFQSVAWGSRSAGSLISGFVGGWLASHLAPQPIFLITMFLPVLVMICVPFIRESKHEQGPFSSLKEPLIRCLALIQTGSMRTYILVLISLAVGSSFGMPFFFFLKETLGFSETFLGFLTSLGWGGAMLGSVVYFRLLRKLPQERVLLFAILINALNIFSTLLIHHAWSAVVLIAIGGFMGCISMLTIMTASAALTHRSGVEGTFFAILMGFFNLGQIASGFIGGRLYPHLGLSPLIVITGCLAMTGLLFARGVKFERIASEAAS